jgi:hypothetical protein
MDEAARRWRLGIETQGQSVVTNLGSWWTKWHWNKFLSELCVFYHTWFIDPLYDTEKAGRKGTSGKLSRYLHRRMLTIQLICR